ncbi:hypothetical protein [Geodermatophilus maliterrae]|uniref:O-antigen ligase like membrane protein n=1 Tax=Geodermatophilus maliterrae TaxID=3162531 RepID=A0ABV3XD89_9ACTN
MAALAAGLLAGLAALVWARPVTAAYLLIGVTPLVAGIDRGVAIPVLRPNEALELVLGATLAVRWLVGLRAGQVPLGRPDAVEAAILLLAVTNSVTPLTTMAVRGQSITTDDLFYSLVLWKLAGVYLIVRSAVRSEREVRTCLLVSVAAASLVAIVGILQGLDLLGVRGFLAQYYAQFGDAAAIITVPRGGSTLSLPAATADLMIMNLAVATALWLRVRRFTVLYGTVVALFVVATLAAGEFSSAIGLVLGIGTLALVTGSLALLGFFGLLGTAGAVAVWPVIAERLEGFSHASGMPVSWVGRLHNLQTYFWPELASPSNFLLGVRPSARVPVASQATGWVWIESGYTWLLWGGGVPLLASFLFLTWAVARRGWAVARDRQDAIGAAGAATLVGIVIVAVLMAFDPHVTYRGSADALFALIALTAGAARRRPGRPAEDREDRSHIDGGRW